MHKAKLYTTSYRRTRQTLAPLAERLGVEAETYDPRDIDALVQRISAADSASFVIVAGHSNTTPALARALGIELQDLDERGSIPDAAYDRLVLLTTSRATSSAQAHAITAVELRY